MKDLLINIVTPLDLSKTRVGVIVYSTNSTLALPLDHYPSLFSFSNELNSIQFLGGGTFTGKALNNSVTSLFNSSVVRSNASKVLVVITDGVSIDDVFIPALLVNSSGITSLAVGIGRNYDRSQLTKIALGEEKRVFSAAKFTSLNGPLFLNDIGDAICRGKMHACFLYNNFYEQIFVKHKKMLSVYKHVVWVLLLIKFKLFRPSISILLPVQYRIPKRCTIVMIAISFHKEMLVTLLLIRSNTTD